MVGWSCPQSSLRGSPIFFDPRLKIPEWTSSGLRIVFAWSYFEKPSSTLEDHNFYFWREKTPYITPNLKIRTDCAPRKFRMEPNMPKFSTLTPPFRVWKTPVGIGRSVGLDTLSPVDEGGTPKNLMEIEDCADRHHVSKTRRGSQLGTSPGLCAQKISSSAHGWKLRSKWNLRTRGSVWSLLAHSHASSANSWRVGHGTATCPQQKRLGAAGGVRCVRLLFLAPLAVSSAAATREILDVTCAGGSLTYVKDPLGFFEEMVKASAACLVNCLVFSGYRCYRSCLLQSLQV